MMPEDRPDYPRLLAVAAASATLLLVLGARLAYLASRPVVAAATPTFDLEASRGSLWDRDGWLLATDRFVYDAVAAPNVIEDAASFAGIVAPFLGRGPDDVAALLVDRSSAWAPLQSGLSPTVANALADLDLGGLDVVRAPRRAYPLGAAAAHVTGFVRADREPAYGVEAHWDAVLRGNSGRMTGNYGSDPRDYLPPTNGADLILTIDRDLQLAAAEILARTIETEEATGGTILVMDPRTGAILASASLPSYDPNDYAHADPEAYRDPASGASYEPGSVIKPLTVAAAIEVGAATPDSTYVDTGSIEVAGITVTNWDHTPHGPTTVTEMLQYSLNVGAVHVATALGAERFYAFLRDLGFGARTGVDLQGEAEGLVHWPDEPGWYAGHLATNSFGQGMAATPIQVLTALSVIANDGRLVTPHVVAARRGPDGTIAPVAPAARGRVLSPATATAVRRMMVEVVGGRVTQAAIPGYSVAGKTGTSEIPVAGGYDPEDTIASFVGFVPGERPEVAILVKVDRPKTVRGSDAAAPIFREVALEAVRTLGIPPDAGPEIGGAP